MKAQLLVLGALHRGAMHPYEIRRRLKAALVECYTDVDVGTLYYCVRQLAAAGHIEVHGSERVARGGTRTIYRITRGGRARFRELLMEHFSAAGSIAGTLYSALLFLHLADLPAVADRITGAAQAAGNRTTGGPCRPATDRQVRRHRRAASPRPPGSSTRTRSQVVASGPQGRGARPGPRFGLAQAACALATPAAPTSCGFGRGERAMTQK